MLTRDDAERLADAVIALGPGESGTAAFFSRLEDRTSSAKLDIPAVKIEYNDLKVVTEARAAASAIPSLPNVALSLLSALTLQKPPTEELTILNNISGQIKPGRLTLLLGPPSSGKTTFLKLLAGRLPAHKYVGRITYNGHRFDEFCPERTTAFVAQVDAHVAAIKARETAAFSYTLQDSDRGGGFQAGRALKHAGLAPADAKGGASSGGSSSLAAVSVEPDPARLADRLAELTDAEFDEVVCQMLDGAGRVDLFVRMFGLARCADTVAGSAMMRGLSGGERKRLSSVEMLMGRQRVFMLDEISTGLDAATLFSVIRWLRTMTHTQKLTVVASLLQPPPETFDLFDDVIVMARGTVLYHGPVPGAVPFFEAQGFMLPPRKDVPSYLQEVTTVKGQVLYASEQLRRERRVPPGLDPNDEVAIAEMELIVSLDEFAAARPRDNASLTQDKAGSAEPMAGLITHRGRYPHPFRVALRELLGRQKMLMLREPALVRARIMQCVVMGLLIGSLFVGQHHTLEDARIFFSAMFLSTLFMGFGGMPQLAVVIANRPIWFKQRSCNLYNASTYAWSMSLVQLPLSIVETLIYSVLVYFLIGFSTDGPGYFLTFWLILITASMAVSALFRSLGCLFHDPAVANAVSGFIFLMLVTNSGFIIVYNSIPPWVVCFYWLSPFAYSIRALAVNEMTSPSWDAPSPRDPGLTLGELALDIFDFQSERYWIWVGVAFNLAFFVVVTQLSAVGLRLLNPPRQPAVLKNKAEIREAIRRAREARSAAEKLLQQVPAAVPPASGESAQPAGAVSSTNLVVGRTIKFQPITVVWKRLCYYVPVPKGLTGAAAENVMPADADAAPLAGKRRLLRDVTGYAAPGVLTALMGGTGAGKTTLMDVLAGRKTQGIITGELLVNGYAKDQATWSRVVGYVEQTDVHSAGLTVTESLEYSAGLRLEAEVSAEARRAYVLEVLLITELLDIGGNLVGEPGVSGLSVEQRRRLSIGIELVASPSVMFLDEPTSGLDARAAAAVMQAVRNVAGNGRTVMVTIHQPSIEIFESFDALVLLGMGGMTIFFGPLGERSCALISYFEAVPGVAKLRPGYNPATWMLEVTGGGAKMYVEQVQVDFPAVYAGSELARHAADAADRLAAAGREGHKPLALASRYAAPLSRQISELIRKQFLVYWRTSSYNFARLSIAVITALIFGMTWYGEGRVPDDGTATLGNVQNIIGSMYAGLSFMGMTNLVAGIPTFTAERQVMYRERAASMYAVLPFGIATGVVEVPYLLVQSVLFVPIAYFMIGFRAAFEPFVLFVIVFMQSISLYTFMGQLFTYLTPSPAVATVLGGLNHLLWNIFNGFLVPNPSIPRGWLWMNYISATTWVIYALAASQLGDNTTRVAVPGYPGCSPGTIDACPSVKDFIEDYFGYRYSFRWWCVLILMAFIVLFRVSAMVVLKVVNHQHR